MMVNQYVFDSRNVFAFDQKKKSILTICFLEYNYLITGGAGYIGSNKNITSKLKPAVLLCIIDDLLFMYIKFLSDVKFFKCNILNLKFHILF